MSDQAMTREKVEFHAAQILCCLPEDIEGHVDVLRSIDAALREELTVRTRERDDLLAGKSVSLADLEYPRLREELETLNTQLDCLRSSDRAYAESQERSIALVLKLREELEKAKQDANLLRRESQEVQACLTDDECPTWDDPCSVQVEDAMALRKDRDRLREELAQATQERDDAVDQWEGAFMRIDSLLFRIDELEEELEGYVWTISPAMAQAKIDELNAKIEKLEGKP